MRKSTLFSSALKIGRALKVFDASLQLSKFTRRKASIPANILPSLLHNPTKCFVNTMYMSVTHHLYSLEVLVLDIDIDRYFI